MMLRKIFTKTVITGAQVGMLVVAAMPALALPFNQDMVNHQKITGSIMRPRPQNAIPVGSLDRQIKNLEQISDWKNPYQDNQDSVNKGMRHFAVNCVPCHGGFKEGKHVPSTLQEKGMPSINLADEAVVYNDPGTRKNPKIDGHFFNYIYNGGILMPPYGYKLSNEEIWHLVSYIRSVQANTIASFGGKEGRYAH